jgi:hypothetical protein
MQCSKRLKRVLFPTDRPSFDKGQMLSLYSVPNVHFGSEEIKYSARTLRMKLLQVLSIIFLWIYHFTVALFVFLVRLFDKHMV